MKNNLRVKKLLFFVNVSILDIFTKKSYIFKLNSSLVFNASFFVCLINDLIYHLLGTTLVL